MKNQQKKTSYRGCRTIILPMAMIFIAIFMANFVSAKISITQYQQFDMKINCFDSTGAKCDTNVVNCSLTILDSTNGSFLVQNAIMTANPTTKMYNYTLSQTKTSKLGQYAATVYCADPAGDPRHINFDVVIIPSLRETNTNDIFLFWFLFGIMWLLIILGAYFQNEILLILAAMGILAFSVTLIISGINIDSYLIKAFAVINIGIGAYILISAGYQLWGNEESNNEDYEE